jgi:hypothetical protein
MDLTQKVVVRSEKYISEERPLSSILSELESIIEDINSTIALNEDFLAKKRNDALKLHTNRNDYDIVLDVCNTRGPIVDTNSVLEGTKKSCQLVIDMTNAGNMPYNVKFILNSRWVRYTYLNSMQNVKNTYSWSLVHISEQAMCPLCHGTYTKIGMGAHIGSMNCVRDQQCLDVKSDGWQILDRAANRAIIKAGIEFKLRPANVDMWVPGWVNEAIKAYYAHGNSFAGLKLNEYLSKIKGD